MVLHERKGVKKMEKNWKKSNLVYAVRWSTLLNNRLWKQYKR